MEEWVRSGIAHVVAATAIYGAGDATFISDGGYTHQYFSPYRPLNWLSGLNGVVLRSTKPNADMLFTHLPLPNERLYKWELIPVNQAAKSAAQTELDGAEGAVQ